MVFNSKGQSLIEMLVAMSAAIVVVSAITVAVISALSNTQFGKNQNLATQYAQEGMEVVRKVRDTDWNKFNSFSLTTGKYCLGKGETMPSKASGALCDTRLMIDNIFAREIEIEKDSGSCNSSGTAQTKVSVFVKWSDGKCDRSNLYCHQASLVSCFTDANLVPTP